MVAIDLSQMEFWRRFPVQMSQSGGFVTWDSSTEKQKFLFVVIFS